MALAESALQSGVGLDAAKWVAEGRLDAALFGEAQSRILVTAEPESAIELESIASRCGVPVLRVGVTTKDRRFRLGADIDLPVDELRKTYEEALPALLAG